MMRAMFLHPLGFWRDHRFTKTHASTFVDGELSGPDKGRVARHAHVCPKCHAMLESLRAVVQGLGTLRGAPDGRVADGVLDALRGCDDH